jgi:hypothetical protein
MAWTACSFLLIKPSDRFVAVLAGKEKASENDMQTTQDLRVVRTGSTNQMRW